MRNPWVHEDEGVDTATSEVHQSHAGLLAVLVWVTLLSLSVAIFVLAGSQLTMPSLDRAIAMLLRVFGVVLFVLFAMPVLLKLLRISRLLTAVVVVGSLGLGAGILLTNRYLFLQEYQLLSELAGREIQETVGLLEELSVLVWN
ncbi:hypothetical protein [Halorubrum sp. Ea8]|uniref:hypothetical protein n=1 Tax=Halorubrum sp. Ea8 TaxID=1383841 RepID=UPI000B99BE2D|nr:hypothetical protein [Halorubrum sp. Ea8]OYR52912.1 hypothetical protein DJ74_00275 [Halorubrum sp. Ea8]